MKTSPSAPRRYGVAVASVALITLARALLHFALEEQAPLMLYTLAVVIAAWYGGFGPGLLATALGTLAGVYFFIPPVHSLYISDSREGAGVLLFCVVGSAVSLVSRARLASDRRAAAAARALGESTAILRAVSDSTPDLIFVKDRESRMLHANPATLRVIGKDSAEVIGKSEAEWHHDPAQAAALMANDRRIMETEEAEVVEEVFTGPEGTRTYLSTKSLLRDERGAVAGVVGLAQDITERKRAEAERDRLLAREQTLRAAAEEASRLKDEFLATLSHELRTPLTSILGWSQMIQAGQLDAANSAHAVEVIQRNARAQARLIEQLLDVSRIISGQLRLETRPVRLAAVAESAVESLRPAAEAKRIRLDFEAGGGVPAISGDPDRLQQVFWNLISNAVKFTPAGGQIRVGMSGADGHAEVTIGDSGDGIAPEFLPHVFDRFRQQDGSTTRRHGGLGLGLSIVRHLVELHGGEVRADSPGVGRGATFTVRLPRASPGGGGPPALKPAAGDDCRVDLGGLTLLVVDDDGDTREMVRAALEACRARVVAVGSAEEALGALGRCRPDVLIADIGMPGMDGYALIERVRGLGAAEGGGVPAIALTAYAGAEDRRRALTAGYHTHMAKPIGPDELAAAIAELVGRAPTDGDSRAAG